MSKNIKNIELHKSKYCSAKRMIVKKLFQYRAKISGRRQGHVVDEHWQKRRICNITWLAFLYIYVYPFFLSSVRFF
jgi:hypothetical protein